MRREVVRCMSWPDVTWTWTDQDVSVCRVLPVSDRPRPVYRRQMPGRRPAQLASTSRAFVPAVTCNQLWRRAVSSDWLSRRSLNDGRRCPSGPRRSGLDAAAAAAGVSISSGRVRRRERASSVIACVARPLPFGQLTPSSVCVNCSPPRTLSE